MQSAFAAVVSLPLAWAPRLLAAETGDLAQLRERALALVNQERVKHGFPELSLEPNLNEAAQAHARDMLERSYYAHVSPEGDTVADRYVTAGGSRWKIVAENIARCAACRPPPTTETVERLHQGWMNSPPHRENILARGLAGFGFGILVGPDRGLYAVQDFAGPGVPRNIQPEEDARVLSPEGQVSLALQVINKARAEKGVPLLERSSPLTEAASVLLPQEAAENFDLKLSNDLLGAIPTNSRARWRSVSVVAGACGGCGGHPTAADVRSFVNQWLDNPQYRSTLLSPELTNLGFVLRANAEGRKVALAVLGNEG